MYELFILGELMDHTMHGYLLNSILNRVAGPLRKISWGVLYPLIRNLESDGLIEQIDEEDESTGRGRKKKSYRITDSGKLRFYLLMEEPIVYGVEYELHAQIKMVNFDQIEDEMKLTILRQYKDFIRYNRRHIENNKEEIVGNPHMPASEIPEVLSVLDLLLLHVEANDAWVNKRIEQFSNRDGSIIK